MSRFDWKTRITAWVLLALLLPFTTDAQTVSKILGSNGSTIADVVPGNTAPGASNKALVVTISPNSPSPGGSQDVNLIKVGGSAVSLGQKTSANSIPMVVASDQSAIPITGSLTPSGTQNVNLTQVGGVALALGQALMTGSIPVAIASNQSAVAISVASLPLPSGAATETTLSALNAKFGAIGQQTMAASASVVIASNQTAVPASQSGTWTVQQGGAPWSMSGSGNFTVVQPTATNLNAAVVGTGVAGTPAGGVLSVQGVSGGQALPISGTVTITPSGTQTVNLGQVGGVAVALGQAANAASIPITISSSQTGSAGTAATQVLSVQGIASMTPVQVSQATAANLNATVVQSTASNLNAQVVGPAASGAAVSGNPVRIGVSDGATTRDALSDSSGRQVVVGGAASGAAVAGNPLLIAGNNAGTARSVSVDSSGQQVVVGPGTAGSASGGVLTVQGIASMVALLVNNPTASNLLAQVFGGAANGAAVSGNPVLMAGYDGTNARTIRTDTTGRPAGSSFYNNVSVNETRTLKSGAGVIRRVCVNPGTTAGQAVAFYDNTAGSGTTIHGLTIGFTSPPAPFCAEYNAAFGTGLTYVSSGGTPNYNFVVVYD